MKKVDPAARGRTYEAAGAQFMCGTGGYDIKMLVSPRMTRLIAGDLLEQTQDWHKAISALPTDHEVPAGVADAVATAYQAALGWVEWLDRKDGKP